MYNGHSLNRDGPPPQNFTTLNGGGGDLKPPGGGASTIYDRDDRAMYSPDGARKPTKLPDLNTFDYFNRDEYLGWKNECWHKVTHDHFMFDIAWDAV